MLRIEIQRKNETATLYCRGRIVFGIEVETLRSVARLRTEPCLEIDLKNVEAVDAAGLGLFVELQASHTAIQERLRLRWAPDHPHAPQRCAEDPAGGFSSSSTTEPLRCGLHDRLTDAITHSAALSSGKPSRLSAPECSKPSRPRSPAGLRLRRTLPGRLASLRTARSASLA